MIEEVEQIVHLLRFCEEMKIKNVEITVSVLSRLIELHKEMLRDIEYLDLYNELHVKDLRIESILKKYL